MNKSRMRNRTKRHVRIQDPMSRAKQRKIKLLKDLYGVGFYRSWSATFYTNNEEGC